MLRAQYLENSWRCYLATIANYYLVCCEAVRSAILATASLLVNTRDCHKNVINDRKLMHCSSAAAGQDTDAVPNVDTSLLGLSGNVT